MRKYDTDQHWSKITSFSPANKSDMSFENFQKIAGDLQDQENLLFCIDVTI